MTMIGVLHAASVSRCQIPDQLKRLRVSLTTILGCCLDRWFCTGSTCIAPLIVIFVIFGIAVIFGIFVTFVKPLSLLCFINLLYLPLSLP